MKVLKWFGALILMLTGLFFVSNARKHKQRADRLTESRVNAEQKTKSGSLKKAERLRKKASTAMDKSKAASDKAKLLEKQLENQNESSLANRVHDFNNRL